MLLHCKGRKKRQIIYCVSASASTRCVPSRKSDGIRSGFQKWLHNNTVAEELKQKSAIQL